MNTYIYDAIFTPEEDGGYSVEIPALEGCFTCGDDYEDAAKMAADAAMTYLASMIKHGEMPPEYRKEACPQGSLLLTLAVPADETYIVDGDVVSAAQAARELGVSPGRVTHMLNAGTLDGYRSGRRTWVAVSSIEARLAEQPKAGRPRKLAAV